MAHVPVRPEPELLNRFELGRLFLLLQGAARYVERRVEDIALVDDHNYAVTVRQQFTVPYHTADEKAQPQEREILVPLGNFSKARVPDLTVVGPDGAELPVLGRQTRGRATAVIFTAGWHKEFFAGLELESADEGDRIWAEIQDRVAEVSSSSREGAYAAVQRLWWFVQDELWLRSQTAVPQGGAVTPAESGLRAVLERIDGEDDFWSELLALAESSPRFARMRAVPGRSYVVTTTYTERFSYTPHGRSLALVGRLLGWLGWVSVPIYRNVANVGEAASLWVVASVPTGVEPVRLFWDARRDELPDETDGVAVHEDRAVAERRAPADDAGPSEDEGLILDVQLRPSPSIFSALALAAFLLFVSTYVFQRIPQLNPTPDQPAGGAETGTLVTLASLFAGVPAAIAGGLAYSGQSFARRMSRGPRTILALLSAQAAFLSIAVSLKGAGRLAEWAAYALSVYCLFAVGAFGWLQWGPRWRKNRRSRWAWATRNLAAERARRRQLRWAASFGAVWLFGVVVFARCQVVLQDDHFFTSEFPGNVWRAWWSLFGL